MRWRRWLPWAWRVRRDAEDELRRELEAHVEGSVDLLVRRGWSEASARREVRRRFGDEGAHIAALRRMALRRVRRRMIRGAVVTIADAIRSALRDVRRSPGLSAGVVAVLIVGIGLNGAVFRVVDRLLLSPPPHVDDPQQVRRLHQSVRYGDAAPRSLDAFTYLDVQALRAVGGGAELGAVMNNMPETLGAGGDAVRVRVARVDADYLPLLRVAPAVGRGFLPEDHRVGAAPVALIGHGLWSSRFGGDASVIGSTIRLGRGDYQVIGVMRKGFAGAQAPAIDVWLPLEPEAVGIWGPGWQEDARILAFRILIRLPEGTSADRWAARVEPVLRRMRERDQPPGEIEALSTSSLAPGSGPDPGPMVAVSRWVSGVSLLVLLVACANVANLFLADGERRRRAMAMRMALGAGAGVLRLELLTRSLVLAALGGSGALLVTGWGGSVLEGIFLEGMELPTRAGTGRLVVFVGAIAIAASVLSGLVPMLRAPRSDVRLTLERGGRVTGGSSGIRRALVGVQVALSMLLLTGAGLFTESFRKALQVDLGFDDERLLVVRLEQHRGSGLPRSALYEDAASRVRALPDVISATPAIGVPFVLLYGLSAGLPGDENVEGLYVNAVGSEYFRTMGIEILRGRPLQASDMVEGSRSVAVVSARTADHLWPAGNPIGRCLAVGESDSCSRVVGVSAEHAGVSWAPGDLLDPEVMQAWVPLGHPEAAPPAALMVRTIGPPQRALDVVRQAAGEAAGVRFVEAEIMSTFVARETRSWRLGATVFSLFGVIALIVAAVGLYAVIAFEVAQRRREFGVRLALGADRLRIMRPVFGSAAPVVLGGAAAGTLIAAAAATRIEPLLFRSSPFEAAVFAAAAGALLLTAAAALVVPAWRAGGVHPREALTEE